MHIQWFFFFLLTFLMCLEWKYGILAWSLILLLSVSVIYVHTNVSNKKLPRYTKDQVYNTLQHGDILNTKYYKPFFGQKVIAPCINFGNIHCCLVIEEQGEKYIIDSSTYKSYKEFEMVEHSDMLHTWTISKIPLREYLYATPVQIFRVFRHPTKQIQIKASDFSFDPIYGKLYYCSLFVGDLLLRNQCIPASSKICRYRPYELIHLLQKNGYEGFTFVS